MTKKKEENQKKEIVSFLFPNEKLENKKKNSNIKQNLSREKLVNKDVFVENKENNKERISQLSYSVDEHLSRKSYSSNHLNEHDKRECEFTELSNLINNGISNDYCNINKNNNVNLQRNNLSFNNLSNYDYKHACKKYCDATTDSNYIYITEKLQNNNEFKIEKEKMADLFFLPIFCNGEVKENETICNQQKLFNFLDNNSNKSDQWQPYTLNDILYKIRTSEKEDDDNNCDVAKQLAVLNESFFSDAASPNSTFSTFSSLSSLPSVSSPASTCVTPPSEAYRFERNNNTDVNDFVNRCNFKYSNFSDEN